MSYTKVYNQKLSVEDGLYKRIIFGKTTLYVTSTTQESVIAKAHSVLQQEENISTYLLCEGNYDNILHEIDDVYDLMEDGNSVTQRARFTLVEGNLYHAEFNVPM